MEIKPEPLAVAIEKAQAIGRIIKKEMPQGWGFVLILSDFNQEGSGAMTYLSSIERESCIKMLKEFIAKAESNYPEIRSSN